MSFEDNPADNDPHGECRYEIERLEAENERLRAESARWHTIVKNDCENETELRKIAERVLSDTDANGDQYGVPTIACVAESLVKEIERLRALNANLLRVCKMVKELFHGREIDWMGKGDRMLAELNKTAKEGDGK